MAQRQRQGNAGSGQFGDTTYTKIFVGGLAWETQRDTMRRYFEQFGEILEAVVITDKATGRSKGYGFVTFKDADSASRACIDPSPVIDGRRANCNLASLGARPTRPTTPQHGGGRYRTAIGSAGAPAYHPPGTSYTQQPQTQYPLRQAFPYQTYGYTGYSQEGIYPMVGFIFQIINVSIAWYLWKQKPVDALKKCLSVKLQTYYSPYGGHQFSHYYPGLGMLPNPAIYPYYTQYLQGSMQYPQMVQYPQPYIPQQQYGSPILSLPANVPFTTVCGEMQQVPCR
ncbi:unnamed protein product [Victoria cruziana]